MTQPTPHSSPSPLPGGRLVAVDPLTLPLVSASLDVDAGGGLARVVLEQRFRNPHTEPLVVEYSLPLPHDAAVSGFAFRVGERRIVGEIDTRGQARKNTFLQNFTRARKLLAECLQRRGIDLALELA